MPKDLQKITAASAENVEITRMRIALQDLLNLQGETVHAAAHVGRAGASQTRTPDGRHHHPRNATSRAAAPPGSRLLDAHTHTARKLDLDQPRPAGAPKPAPLAAAGVSGDAAIRIGNRRILEPFALFVSAARRHR